MRVKRAGRVVAAVCLALLVSSCGGPTAPGVAASVDGDTITDDQVDSFAKVLCELGGLPGQTASGAPTRNARARALELLIGNELAFDLGRGLDVDQAAVDNAVAQNAPARDLLSAGQTETFDSFVERFARAQMTVIAAGRRALEQSGARPASVSDDQAYAAGQQLRLALAQQADIDIDPRFGRWSDGVVTPASGSLSVPESQEAKDAQEAQPSDSAVAALPAALRCGPGE